MTMEKQFYSGLLMGFFLATGLLFGAVQIFMAPHYSDLVQLQGYAQQGYQFTHSQTYMEMQTFVEKLNEGANALAGMPLIGALVTKENVPVYTQNVLTMVKHARTLSEDAVWALSSIISIIQIALIGFLASVAMVVVGYYYRTEKKAGKKR